MIDCFSSSEGGDAHGRLSGHQEGVSKRLKIRDSWCGASKTKPLPNTI